MILHLHDDALCTYEKIETKMQQSIQMSLKELDISAWKKKDNQLKNTTFYLHYISHQMIEIPIKTPLLS